MTLADFLEANKITLTAFAEVIDVSVEAVRRYRDGMRIPQPEIMDRIKRATGGCVMPNDFYESDEQSSTPSAGVAA